LRAKNYKKIRRKGEEKGLTEGNAVGTPAIPDLEKQEARPKHEQVLDVPPLRVAHCSF
jgi:hypothetical protein